MPSSETGVRNLAFCCLLFAARSVPAGEEDLRFDERAKELRTEYGVEIRHRYCKCCFPGRWLEPPFSVSGSQAIEDDTAIALEASAHFLAAYPKGVTRANLRAICLLGSLRIRGKVCGGTNSKDAIYVNVSGLSAGRKSREFLVERLHSEFSSVLMRNYEFPADVWTRCNDKDWKYTGDPLSLVEAERAYRGDAALHASGFLNLYATTSIENDVNMFAASRFSRRKELVALAEANRRIALKLELVDAFYERVFESTSRAVDGEEAERGSKPSGG